MNPDIERLREEAHALGLLSYHGAPWSDDVVQVWLADLDRDDVERIRSLLVGAAAALEAANDRASEAQEALHYIRDEVLDGALIRAESAEAALEQTRAALRETRDALAPFVAYGRELHIGMYVEIEVRVPKAAYDRARRALAAAPERQDAACNGGVLCESTRHDAGCKSAEEGGDRG